MRLASLYIGLHLFSLSQAPCVMCTAWFDYLEKEIILHMCVYVCVCVCVRLCLCRLSVAKP